jgi:hypothetical protein
MKCISVAILAFIVGVSQAQTADVKPNNNIQLAILLDVSGSMDGLIKQAQEELWAVVNEVAKAKKNGIPSNVNIGLYSYGNGSSSANGFIHQLVQFTGDVDTISKVLFALRTSGSSEYCGQVLSKAQEELLWSSVDSVYKVIFIAGNEEFTQGPVNYVNACETALAKRITINTIHCGDQNAGRSGGWANAAKLGRGQYFWIDANTVEPFVPSPYDSIIDNHNIRLNGTYKWGFGGKSEEYKTNQIQGDANNKLANQKAYYDRVKSKSKEHVYEKNTAKWDLNAKVKLDSTSLVSIPDAQLPDEMKGKTLAQKKQMLADNQVVRDSAAAGIKEYSRLRDEYVKQWKLSNPTAVTTQSLGEAIAVAVRKQAELLGFVFETPTVAK